MQLRRSKGVLNGRSHLTTIIATLLLLLLTITVTRVEAASLRDRIRQQLVLGDGEAMGDADADDSSTNPTWCSASNGFPVCGNATYMVSACYNQVRTPRSALYCCEMPDGTTQGTVSGNCPPGAKTTTGCRCPPIRRTPQCTAAAGYPYCADPSTSICYLQQGNSFCCDLVGGTTSATTTSVCGVNAIQDQPCACPQVTSGPTATPTNQPSGPPTTPAPTTLPPRKFTVVNKCSKPIRLVFTSNSLPGARYNTTTNAPIPDNCSTDAECRQLYGVPNVACNPNSKFCFGFLQGVENGETLDAGKNTTIDLKNAYTVYQPKSPPATGVDPQTVYWQGNFLAATGCKDVPTGQQCVVGTVISPNPVYSQWMWNTGAVDKPNRVEIGFFVNRADTMDINMLEGMSLPVEIVPDVGSYEQFLSTTSFYQNCSAIGSNKTYPQASASDWRLDGRKMSPLYKLLDPFAFENPGVQTTPCQSDADCTGSAMGPTCGLNWNAWTNPLSFSLVCGKQVSWILPNGICGFNPMANLSGLNCGEALGSGTMANLLGCSEGYDHSEYNSDPGQSDSNTCGSSFWALGWNATAGFDVNIPIDAGVTCPFNNTVWVQKVMPSLVPFKRACPQCYVYPYDDKTSTFACGPPGGLNETNTANYTVTFCPEGDPKDWNPWGSVYPTVE